MISHSLDNYFCKIQTQLSNFFRLKSAIYLQLMLGFDKDSQVQTNRGRTVQLFTLKWMQGSEPSIVFSNRATFTHIVAKSSLKKSKINFIPNCKKVILKILALAHKQKSLESLGFVKLKVFSRFQLRLQNDFGYIFLQTSIE